MKKSKLNLRRCGRTGSFPFFGSAGANEAIEEYKNKVIDKQVEAIKGVAPDIVIIEV